MIVYFYIVSSHNYFLIMLIFRESWIFYICMNYGSKYMLHAETRLGNYWPEKMSLWPITTKSAISCGTAILKHMYACTQNTHIKLTRICINVFVFLRLFQNNCNLIMLSIYKFLKATTSSSLYLYTSLIIFFIIRTHCSTHCL